MMKQSYNKRFFPQTCGKSECSTKPQKAEKHTEKMTHNHQNPAIGRKDRTTRKTARQKIQLKIRRRVLNLSNVDLIFYSFGS
jgi:hypothetical protein